MREIPASLATTSVPPTTWDAPGWHSRGYLPHVDHPHLCQAVTFRLADALPQQVLAAWHRELAEETSAQQRGQLLRRRIASYEDAGHGSCLLADPACATILRNLLSAGDGHEYRLIAWVIMPNHVHVILGPTAAGRRLLVPRIVRTWKGVSARRINRHCQRQGQLWQAEVFDRFIRDRVHLQASVAYVLNNPVEAGLCRTAGEWPWSGNSAAD